MMVSSCYARCDYPVYLYVYLYFYVSLLYHYPCLVYLNPVSVIPITCLLLLNICHSVFSSVISIVVIKYHVIIKYHIIPIIICYTSIIISAIPLHLTSFIPIISRCIYITITLTFIILLFYHYDLYSIFITALRFMFTFRLRFKFSFMLRYVTLR